MLLGEEDAEASADKNPVSNVGDARLSLAVLALEAQLELPRLNECQSGHPGTCLAVLCALRSYSVLPYVVNNDMHCFSANCRDLKWLAGWCESCFTECRSCVTFLDCACVGGTVDH